MDKDANKESGKWVSYIEDNNEVMNGGEAAEIEFDNAVGVL